MSEDKKLVSFLLREETHARMKKIKKETGLPISSQIQQALDKTEAQK